MMASDLPSSSAQAKRIAVAVSGSGRSLANFLKVQEEDRSFVVGAVIASRQDCYAVTIAKEHGLPVFVGSFKRDHLAILEPAMYQWLDEQQIHWVALAGFLKHFPVHTGWEGRIVNIHPSLLPKFGGQGMYGDRVHQAVLAHKESWSGATVHFVNDRYDEGDMIAQVRVPVLQDDSVHSLAQRVFQAECLLYPDVMTKLIRGDLPLPNGQVLRVEHAVP